MNWLLVNPTYGTSEVSKELKDKLSYVNLLKDKEGKILIDEETGQAIGQEQSKWGELSFFTRDIRLGNLTDEELYIVRDRLKLAGCLLEADCPRAFKLCYSEAIGIIESSQSKKGFLRGKFNTLRTENINENKEPPKKSFFGANKGF